MTRAQRARYQTFVNVTTFGVTNRQLFPESSAGGQAFAAVGEAVAAIDEDVKNQLAAVAQVRRERSRTRAALRNELKAIVHTARGLAADGAETTNPFVMPATKNDAAMIDSAKWFLTAAEPLKDGFVQLGMRPSFISELQQLTDTFVDAWQARQNGRMARASARAGITSALERGFQAVRKLDAVVPNIVGQDPERFAAWQVARRIERPSRRGAEPAVTVSVAAPVHAS